MVVIKKLAKGKRVKKRKTNRKLIILIFIISIIFISSIFIYYVPNSLLPKWDNILTSLNLSDHKVAPKDYAMSVHIMDVGKADSIYINCKDKNILIDAGDKDIRHTVKEYLKRHNVEDFDLVVASHPHRDHIGQMEDIIKDFSVLKFMMPDLPDNIVPTYKTYENMLISLRKKNVDVEKPSAGDSFSIGEMKIQILAPLSKYDSINNNSIVVRVTYGNDSFLFTGDIERAAEIDLVNSGYDLKSNVLKVAHHGSATSTTQKFLNAVKPQYAVISVGPDSSDLPKESTINRLRENNITIYRTDTEGNILITTNGNGVSFYN